jgi:hypothetical protein
MADMRLPNELWLRIFEDNTDVLDRYDLSVVIRTCKTFRELATKNLYRHVVWKNPISLVHCLGFLRRVRGSDEESLLLPKSLTIGISRMSKNGRSLIVGVDARILPAQREQWLPTTQVERRDFTSFAVLDSGDTACDFRIPLFASAALYESMLNFAQLLVSLRELTFTNAILPDTIHSLLHHFPNLQKLHLEMCVIPPTVSNASVDHTVLPITELTLRSLYHAIDVLHHPDQELANLNPDKVFSLATAQSLETLRVDTTARIFTLFNRPTSPPVPPNLKRLFLHRPKLTKNDSRVAGMGPTQRRAQETASLMLGISLFLTGAPKIESISTCFAFSDANFQLQLVQPNHFDAEHLREFSGPIASLSFPPLTSARNLRAVHFIDDKMVFLSNAQKFADDFERLEVLSFQITTPWDDEMVLAACSVFLNVVRVRIEYSGPGPNDVGPRWFRKWAGAHGFFQNFIVSLGPQVLAKMERLHTFQLFETNGKLPVITDDCWGDDWTSEGMLKTLILPWNKYCPQLKEVQLVDGYLWRRAHGKDSWAQRCFPPETDEDIWKTSVF